MNLFQLKKTGSEEILYEGVFDTLKACVEAAVCGGICLDYVDLRGANLMNAEMDDSIFNHARFDRANLTGANLSAAQLSGAVFQDAVLYNTCLCEAVMTQAQFFGASFGASDIAWADLTGAMFDTLSSLDLNFSEALMTSSSFFYDRTGTICEMSRPPVVIKGLSHIVVLFDEYMKVGSAVLPYDVWLQMRDSGALANLGGDAAAFMRIYGRLLFSLAEARMSDEGVSGRQHQKNVA
ncbi:MAG: pentapeptide repeat-containing protein [Rhodospirillales bacterium]|nr:pentapeptide repeat-containing protein [Rhodospirillales bacterium]MCB9980474.1 pentapeptide repeat-containing protein [Rhodospirillales bacterium]